MNNKKLTFMQKVKYGAIIGGAITIVVLEKRRVAELMVGATALYNEGVDEAFENGVKYGLGLAKDVGIASGQYAFGAFDKPA